MDGGWSCDDLVGLVQVLVRNRDVLDSLESGWARLVQPFRALGHALRANTKRVEGGLVSSTHGCSEGSFGLLFL